MQSTQQDKFKSIKDELLKEFDQNPKLLLDELVETNTNVNVTDEATRPTFPILTELTMPEIPTKVQKRHMGFLTL
jgi:hypothetical protein